jgi:hypothetical protein
MDQDLPPIVSYHPEIQVVGKCGGFHLIYANREDWCSDREVLSDLGKRFGVGTVGDLVEKLKGVEGDHGCRLEVGVSGLRDVHLADEVIG